MLEAAGVEIWDMPEAETLVPLLARMARTGISTLYVEGGARTAALFLDAGLVDRIVLFHAAVEIGADGIAAPAALAKLSPAFHLIRQEIFGTDRCLTYERDI